MAKLHLRKVNYCTNFNFKTERIENPVRFYVGWVVTELKGSGEFYIPKTYEGLNIIGITWKAYEYMSDYHSGSKIEAYYSVHPKLYFYPETLLFIMLPKRYNNANKVFPVYYPYGLNRSWDYHLGGVTYNQNHNILSHLLETTGCSYNAGYASNGKILITKEQYGRKHSAEPNIGEMWNSDYEELDDYKVCFNYFNDPYISWTEIKDVLANNLTGIAHCRYSFENTSKPLEIVAFAYNFINGYDVDIETLKPTNPDDPKASNVQPKPVTVKSVGSATSTPVRSTSTKISSTQPKTIPVKRTSSTTSTTNTKKTSTKKVTSSPVKSVEQQVKKEKPSISDEPVNILDISTKTKIGKFYKIEKVENKAKKIIIDDSVSEIASNAFQNCRLLEEITLGKNLKVLEFGLFNYLSKLEKVNFVEGLVTIKNNVFDNSGLTGKYKLPKSLKSIGKLSFNVKLPESLQLNISKETELDEKAIHRLVKVEYYETTKSKTKSNITNNPKVTQQVTNKPTQVSNEVEENYMKGKEIYYKYSGKKKMLEAAKLMEAKANTDDLDACFCVADAYIVAEKYANADKYIDIIVKNKKVDNILWFANKLYFVKGYGSRAKDLYLIAAENGMIDAYDNVASYYFRVEDHQKALESYLKGADLGSALCLRHLASVYRAGLSGVTKPNNKKYVFYLQKAVEAGDSIAQYWLGCAYYQGTYGFSVDKKKANFWFEKAANNPKNPVDSAKLALQGDYSHLD